jgi:hypothetical protein
MIPQESTVRHKGSLLSSVGRVRKMGGICRTVGTKSIGVPCPRIYGTLRGILELEDFSQNLSYKYFLFLAQDCNFRLVNRNVGTAAKDPIVADGCGYFVNHEKYTEFLCNHVTEEEISTCSGFQALFLANKKRVKGLRTTGVGGVTCARHNMWRANGIGDLQLGERYVRSKA